MSFRARRILIRGVASVVVGAGLAASVVLAAGAVPDAENDAKQRAEDYANSVVYKALTPGMIGQPIDGSDYGSVLVQVQAGILKDDDVVRVRVWNGSGMLVFSSDQRDRLGQQAGFGGVLNRVLDGTTVTDVTDARVAPEPGLAGSNDRLFVSYVPLRLGGETLPSAAVEVDQRYSAILAAANRIWRPLQIGLGVILVFALAMFLAAFRSRTDWSGSDLAGDPRAAERLRSLQKQMKELERQAREADDRAKQAGDRVRAAEERADALTEAKTALEQQLASAEGNLREAVTASRTSQDDATALASRVPEFEREIAELRARAEAAESVAPDVSAEDLAAAQGRAAELETRVGEAEARALGAEQRLADSDRRAAEIELRSTSSVEQAQVDLDRISIRLSETQAALAESTDKTTRLQSDLQRVQQERDDALAELQRAGLATGERDQEVERLRAAIAERDELLRDLQRTVLERNAELEQMRSGLGERSGEIEQARAEAAAQAAELEHLRTETAAKGAELDQLRTEAVAKNAELDQLRTEALARNAELDRLRAEVQQVNEQLTSAQLELKQARQRVEGLEDRSPESPVFEPPDEAAVGSRLSALRKRTSSRSEDVPVPTEQSGPPVVAQPHGESEEHHDDPPTPDTSPEGLSLRERLTRAAAARHRVTTPSDTEQR
jgi:predicted  nucleic acid-binding Zn-ribbon protein